MKGMIEEEIMNRQQQTNEQMFKENEELKKLVKALSQEKSDYEKRFLGIESVNKQQHEQIKRLMERNERLREHESVNADFQEQGRGRAKRARTSGTHNIETAPLHNQIIDVITPILRNFGDDLFERMRQELKPVLTRQTPKTVSTNSKSIAPRQRSSSRERTHERDERTFASVLAAIKTPIASYRNIVCEGENARELQQKLAKDNICSDVRILSIKKKGKNFTTIKCVSEEDAVKLEQKLNAKYRGDVKITNINRKSPQVKIINIDSELQGLNILELIKGQNLFLQNSEITAERSYIIRTERTTYKNLIINTDLQTQQQIIERRYLIIGLEEKGCFEYIDLLQCARCYRYGHI